MDALTSLWELLNNLSPLAVIAMLATVIFLLVRGKTAADTKIDIIKGNDLHELPTMAEDIRAMAATMQRLEVKISEEFSYLRARLNGKS